MFTAPLNNLVLKIYPKYIGNYSNIIKAANLNPGTQLNPADLVNIIGEVVSIPKKISKGKFNFDGFTTDDIEAGDKVLLRFDVVFDLVEQEFSDVPLYKNMVWYKGQEYFLARIDKVHGILKADGRIIMINGFCMLEEIEEEARIFMPQTQKRITRSKEATLSHIGNSKSNEKGIEAKQGDRVLVHPYRIQHYQIGQKKFGIVSQKDVFGVVAK